MNAKRDYPRYFFLVCLLLILYLFYRMVEPFFISVILSVTITSLFYPAYSRLKERLYGYASLSSLIMCTVITILIILPSVLFSIAFFDEINQAYTDFQTRVELGEVRWLSLEEYDSLPGDGLRLILDYLGGDEANLAQIASSLLGNLANFLLDHYSTILGGLGTVVAQFFIMIFSMFFFFRDGDKLVAEIKRLIPLAPRYEEMVLHKLKDVTFATFFGVFATAICQGIVAGIIFTILGISSPIVWGTATAFCALVPIVGTAAIWVPMSIFLIIQGFVLKGVILLILGSTVIGLVDNFIRPLIIEERSGGIHLLLVFFSLIGGVWMFGPPGLVIGPLVAALLVTFLEIYKTEFEDDLL
jgi:predicted PurR-regulated permease PerM